MKITHRKKVMDSFIKFWSKILIENPDFNMNFLFTLDYVYMKASL